MENLMLTQYHFHSIKQINENNLQLIHQLNDEIISINYLSNIMIYSFEGNEYINLQDLLFFKDKNILAISKGQIIEISIQILETLIKLQKLNIYHNQIKIENIWIWVSQPLSSKQNNQIEFKAFFSMYTKISSYKQNDDFQCVKNIIKNICSKNNYQDIDNYRDAQQIIEKLKLNLQQIGIEQPINGSYDPKLIENFLKNKKLYDEEFQNLFGESNGIQFRNIILNWAIKHQKQFINSSNCAQLSIKDLAIELNIDGWFYELFKQMKQYRYLEDFLFYKFLDLEALNDLSKINTNSNIQHQMNLDILQQSYIDYENNKHESLFPQLTKFYDITQTLDLIKSYNDEINQIIQQGQSVINKFYKNFPPIPFNQIQEFKFYKQGLNLLDNYLQDGQIDINSFIQNPQQHKAIKKELSTILNNEIQQIFQNLIQKQNKKIANSLLYNENNIY